MNTEKLEKLKKSLDNKFIPDNMKDKIRAEIKKLEADIKTDETITATEVKEEVKEIEKKVEKALEVAEEKEEKAEAKKEEAEERAEAKAEEKKAKKSRTKTQKVEGKPKSAKKSVFSIAKEIRKDGETWEEAKDRARKMMKSETTETKKKTKTETQKLLAMVRRNKEYKKLTGSSDLPKDAQRRALPRGKRVSSNGNVYYENRANRVDVGGFKNAYLENGGGVDGIIELKPLELIPLSTQLNRLSGYNWTSGDWESEDGGKPSTMPNSVIVNVHTKQKFRLSPFYIYEGYDHYNSKPLYRVEDASEEGEYVGEWYTKREDAEQELKEMFGSYADKGVYVETLDEEIDLTDDGKPRVIKTQQGGNKSFGERREMHGASPEALAFDNGGKVGRYSILGEVDGGQPVLYATTDDKERIKPLVNMAEIDLYELTGKNHRIFVTDEVTDDEVYHYGNGGRTRERRYVNYSQDYEVRYSKDKPHRRGYGYENGGSIEDERFKKFINSQVSYIISLKTISQKREPIQNLLDNMEDYRSGSEVVKRITTDNLKYALQQKTVSKMNEVLRISLNALQYADGGTIIGTPETPLARGLDIDYTGLVGETGGMSAGEMFAEGGSIGQMVNFEDWQLYDRDTDLERMKKSCNAIRKNGFKAIVVEDKGMYYVLYKSMSDSEGKRVYAEGGSLGNHGLKQGDEIIKTMSGGVQKVKTKSGDIVYVNLANGYRGAEPPLPFAKGGGVEKRSLKSVIHLVDWKGEGIKKWYLRSYPKDEMGEELNDTVTFKDLWDALNEKKDVYEIIGVGDSLIRERLFEYLALLYNVDYDVVYKKWLESDDYAKGGYTNERRHVNKAQDYEVRYAKNKPNRTGYFGKRSFDDGGEISSKQLDLGYQYSFEKDEDNVGSLYKEAGVYSVIGFENGKHFSESFEKFSDAKKFYLDKKGKVKFDDGGLIEEFNPKSFSLAEIDEKLRDNDIYIQWLQMGDMNTPSNKREMLWNNTRSSTEWKKVKDLRLTISDYGLLELSKGSENLYLNFVVYEKDGYDPMNIQIYTKDNHAGLKQFARQIVDKFEEGGFMTDPNFGDFQNGVYANGGGVDGFKTYKDFYSSKYLDKKSEIDYVNAEAYIGSYKVPNTLLEGFIRNFSSTLNFFKSVVDDDGNYVKETNPKVILKSFKEAIRQWGIRSNYFDNKYNDVAISFQKMMDKLYDVQDLSEIKIKLDNSRSGNNFATGGVTKNYINRNQLNTITIKKGNQKLTYKVSDVYNGAYKLEEGGNLEKTAFYVSKRNVVKVQLKNGKDVKVANGYWIKKGAKPIHTSKYDDGGMTEKEFMQKEINSQKEIEKGKVFKKYRVNVYENGFPFVEPLMTDNLLEAINFAKKTIEEQRKYRASSKDLFAEISEFTPIEKRDNVRYAYNRIGSLSEEDLKSSKYEDGGQLEMKFLKGGKLESKIQKKVDEVNSLIEKAIDKDGDPIMVVDKSGTWEEPMQYKPIVYKNGRLYFEYYEPYSGKTKKEVVNKSNIDFDGYPMLLDIAKMYRSALKQKGVSFAGGGSTNKEIEINSEIEKIIEEIKSKGKYEKGKESVNVKGQKYRWDFYKLENPSYFLIKKIDSIQFKNYGQLTLSNSFDYGKLKLPNNKDITIDRPTYKGQSSKFVTYRELVLLNAGGGYLKNGYFKNEIDNDYIEEINKYYNKWNSIKDEKDSENFKKTKPPMFGTYKTTDILEQIKHFEKLDIPFQANEVSRNQFKKEVSKIIDNFTNKKSYGKGGSTKRGGAMQLAKEIRKDGESWQSALKRANEQMRKK